MSRTEIHEGCRDGTRLIQNLKWGFAWGLSKSSRHWTVPSDELILGFFILTAWHYKSMPCETGRKHRFTPEFLEDLQILLWLISASVIGNAEWHVMALDRERLCWGLGVPGDWWPFYSFFPLPPFHWKCPSTGPFVPLMSKNLSLVRDLCKQNWYK